MTSSSNKTPQNVAILGATGLIGSHILSLCEESSEIKNITIISRRPLEINHPKTEVKVIDFEDENQFKSALQGCDSIFCAVGTTQANVDGDNEAFKKVDFKIPADASRFGAEAGAKRFLMVSSVGADHKSNNFYLKTKGEAEAAVKESGIEQIAIFRPSLLLGDRDEFRLGEKLGSVFMQTFSFFIPAKYKAVDAENVARAMLKASFQQAEKQKIYHYDEMKGLFDNC